MAKNKIKEFVCSLCGDPCEGFGNNPEPLKGFDERCCDQCNRELVIPARLGAFLKEKKEERVEEVKPVIRVSNDPYYNLLGALHDLENGVNDDVVHDTIRRVLSQIKPERLQK
jgi:hypothetical protein